MRLSTQARINGQNSTDISPVSGCKKSDWRQLETGGILRGFLQSPVPFPPLGGMECDWREMRGRVESGTGDWMKAKHNLLRKNTTVRKLK